VAHDNTVRKRNAMFGATVSQRHGRRFSRSKEAKRNARDSSSCERNNGLDLDARTKILVLILVMTLVAPQPAKGQFIDVAAIVSAIGAD